MSAEARVQETPAEAALIEQFGDYKNTLPAGDKLLPAREKAFEEFQKVGLPHRRVEDWHYTDLRAKMRSAFVPAHLSSNKELADTVGASGLECHRITILNGRYNAELSKLLPEAEGTLEVVPLDEAINGNGAALLGTLATTKDVAIQLNTAFMQGGVALNVQAGKKLEKPVEILHVVDEANVATYPRVLVNVEEGADVLFIESFEGSPEAAYQSNTVTELKAADTAKVGWVKLQLESTSAQHIESFAVELGANVNFQHFIFNDGADLSRTQLYVDMKGEETHAALRGVSLLNNTQHSDITLFVNHLVPNCDSREYFKAVVDDKARSVMQGKIVVAPDAQKTDAQMMVQSLLLSEHAEVNAKPELEIFADDVQCAHGSTMGEIDEDLLFYLRARGIPEKQARKLLILAFLSEAIEEFEDERVSELLGGLTRQWLHAEEV